VKKQIIYHHFELHRFRPRPFHWDGCGFSYSYYARPWSIFSDLWHDFTSFVHRGLYGWDITDTWNLDHHLLKLLPQLLRAMIESKPGTPVWCAEAANPDHNWEQDPFGQDADWERAEAYFAQWIEDRAQACEILAQLREDGPYTQFDYPLDSVPQPEMEKAMASYNAQAVFLTDKIKSLFDRLESLWT